MHSHQRGYEGSAQLSQGATAVLMLIGAKSSRIILKSHRQVFRKAPRNPEIVLLCFAPSVVTEGFETRQHRDAARYRPHGQVAHTGVRVPGENFEKLCLHILRDSDILLPADAKSHIFT